MSKQQDPRLERLLGSDALAGLRERLRRHFERTDASDPGGVLRLNNISASEYEALAGLMGRRPRSSSSISIDLSTIDAALRRAGIADSLRDALERLDGKIIHHASARAERAARWSAIVAGTQHPDLAALLALPEGLGLLKRLARQDHETASRMRGHAERVLCRLPAPGTPLAQLAAETLGNAHSLDAGEPLATLVLAVLRQRDKAPDPDPSGNSDEVRQDERARDLWARAGVLVNELARPALVLNLPFKADSRSMFEPGEPCFMSLRFLLRRTLAFAVEGRAVYVCENPNLLAVMADRLGAASAPLVCTEGMPAAAQRVLLTLLSKAGARLMYHGDYDWPGIRIANHVLATYGARAWRYSASEYEAALSSAQHPMHLLSGNSVLASWDPGLAPMMEARGIAVAEESLVGMLVEDLAG